MPEFNLTDSKIYNAIKDSSLYFVQIGTEYSTNAFRNEAQGNALSRFGVTSKKSIEDLSDFFADVSIVKYTILADKIFLLLYVKGELQNNALHLMRITPYGIYALITRLKGNVSKKTGVYIWNKSFDIYTVSSKEEFVSVCSFMNGYKETSTVKP